MSDESGGYEVVIGADGDMEKDHAELVKRQLTRDGFHEHAVEVRKAGTDGD